MGREGSVQGRPKTALVRFEPKVPWCWDLHQGLTPSYDPDCVELNFTNMMPKISDQYFLSLLSQPEAVHAISTISSFWSHRANDVKPMYGLSLPEYQCQLVLIYTGEVGSGGHSQFFLNRGDDRIGDHVAALDAVLLPDLARILGRAAEKKADLQELRRLDQQVHSRLPEVDQALQAFLLENSSLVLQRERSM